MTAAPRSAMLRGEERRAARRAFIIRLIVLLILICLCLIAYDPAHRLHPLSGIPDSATQTTATK